MDNKAADKTPGMGASEEISFLDAIENDIIAITIDTTVDL